MTRTLLSADSPAIHTDVDEGARGGQVRRIVICEDSRTYASALTRALEHDGAHSVVGVFSSAEETLDALPSLQPDLVTVDLELPGISGLVAIERIMRTGPVPILVLSAHLGEPGKTPGAALAAGALDALSKSRLDLRDPAGVDASALRRRADLLGGARLHRPPAARRRSIRMVGICASTGGPQALSELLRALPATFPAPILVVQHISAGFVDGLARLLDQTVPLPVRVARDGEHPVRGISIAPDGAHLMLGIRGRLTLDRSTSSAGHRPSGDVLFSSMAAQLGAESAAVVLTGMGRDGADGLGAVQEAGGLTIAQDEATSAIFGMPKAAIAHGAEFVLPLAGIGPRLIEATEERS